MECNISKPTKRIDVPDKIAGKAKYIGDYKLEGMLYGKTLRSTKARAKIVKIEYPKLPDGYYIVDKDDVPGTNLVKIIINDQPFFADERVNYIGEAIALVVGEDKKEVLNILSKINIEYEELEPILTIDDGLNKSKEAIYGDTNCFGDYEYKKGNVEDIKQKSIYVVEGEYETGYQEQLYLEPQGVIAVCEGDKVSIYGSIQCPYYVKGAVEQCMGPPEDKVRIIQAVTGGGFGGKEDFPSLIAGQAACAALKTKRPVQIIYDRDEDLEVTPKRHPSKIKIKSYLDKDYRILGSEVDIKLDAGAYSGLSNVVLQRTMFAAIGNYNVENVVVKGKSVATNKTVSGAFRGFGAPQAFFAVEMHMEHIAKQLGIDSLEFKMKNLLKKGDKSS
ncbi:MAG: molybdopterin cofactor-binding domain-containing protein, partial [Clostridium sp.]|nr:molybdopterin cofactor-binding domain-containing protein [Clostridium sp.]